MYKTLLAIIAIISTLSMVNAMMIQEASAAPKDYKYNSHYKSTYDSDENSAETKGGFNSNGPGGHTNCKSSGSYDYDTGEYDYDERCKSN